MCYGRRLMKTPLLMSKLLLLVVLGLNWLLCVSVAAECLGDNTKPMFGYDPLHKENHCDRAFLTAVLTPPNRKEDAFTQVLSYGWESLNSQPPDLGKAIKRFNQAWLIDRQNAKVFHAFGVWEKEENNLARSEEFLKTSIKINSDDFFVHNDLANTLISRANTQSGRDRLNSLRNADKSAKKSIGLNKNFAPSHINRAVILYSQDQPAAAWKEVQIAEQLEPQLVSSQFGGFIKMLEKRIPRPSKN
jgi:tetratricopeptide (TPR) repeat protein